MGVVSRLWRRKPKTANDTGGYNLKKQSEQDVAGGVRGRKTKHESISTGTFGNLVKKASSDEAQGDKPIQEHQKVRFNLLKVGPMKDKNETDSCEAWNKYQF